MGVTPSASFEFSMAFPRRQAWNPSPHLTAHSSYFFQLDIRFFPPNLFLLSWMCKYWTSEWQTLNFCNLQSSHRHRHPSISGRLVYLFTFFSHATSGFVAMKLWQDAAVVLNRTLSWMLIFKILFFFSSRFPCKMGNRS